MQDLAQRVAEDEHLWSDALEQTTDHRSYVDVFTNEHVGVWAISWMADTHDTGYHDHDRSRGAVHVARGAIRHEHLRLGYRPVGRVVEAGDGFRFDETVIHRMRPEPGHEPTITVHAYSPPLVNTGQYGDGLLHRTPGPAQDQLKPKGDQGDPGLVADGAGAPGHPPTTRSADIRSP